MTRTRALVAMLAVLLTTTVIFTAIAAGTPESPGPTGPPGAPAACTATPILRTINDPDDYRVRWRRPTDDGGSPIWRYTLKVKHLRSPRVWLSSAHKQENTARAVKWT